MKARKALAAVAVALGVVVGLVGVGQPVMAKIKCPDDTARPGAEVNSLAECNFSDDHAENTLVSTVGTIINVVLGVLGLAAIVMVIIGGVTFITSQGDAAKVMKARNTILYGIIGLVVALLAFAIVNFLVKTVFSPKPKDGDNESRSYSITTEIA